MKPSLVTHLSREDLLSVFAVAFCSTFETYQEEFNLEAYASPGLEGPTNSFGELLRRSIRLLHQEYGSTFPGLEILPSGNVSLVAEQEIRNTLFLLRASKNRLFGQPHGAMPIDPGIALRVAIDRLPDLAPGLPLSSLKEALYEVEQARKEWRDRLTPDQLQEEAEAVDSSLATLGVVRTPHQEEIH